MLLPTDDTTNSVTLMDLDNSILLPWKQLSTVIKLSMVSKPSKCLNS